MHKVRVLVTTTLAAGTLLLSAGAASAATPAPVPMTGQQISQCARTMGFSGTHNPATMRKTMSGMDMDMAMTMTTSPPTKSADRFEDRRNERQWRQAES